MKQANKLKSSILCFIARHWLDEDDLIYLIAEKMDRNGIDNIESTAEGKKGLIIVNAFREK